MPITGSDLQFSKRSSKKHRNTLFFAVLPALSLSIYWFSGESGLILFALCAPLFMVVFNAFQANSAADRRLEDDPSGTAKLQLETYVNDMLFLAKPNERLVLFNVEIDNALDVAQRLGSAQLHDVQKRLQMRYVSCLRSKDIVFQSGPLHWTIAISPGANLNLEVAINQAARLQEVLEDPLFIEDDRLYLTSCVGFTLAQKPFKSAHVLLAQSASALSEAMLNGPDCVRAFSAFSNKRSPTKPFASMEDLNGELASSLFAWFQPQVSTDTGHISGFEALARWKDRSGQWHSPAMILPVLEQAGQMEKLTDQILAQSLSALNKWDERGLKIETVGVNFSESDLSNPRLYEKVAWDMDRHGIEPNRLCIEVLESVIAGGTDDMIVRNVTRLADLGCQIDLDDFGTGHSSISTLRSLPVHRLKIDRSFVAKSDLDTEQQKMVATILMMAERLDLNCLAEGVETLGEQSILAQLGCGYVQGFGIAKPMPFEDTLEWIENFQAKHVVPPEIGRKTS